MIRAFLYWGAILICSASAFAGGGGAGAGASGSPCAAYFAGTMGADEGGAARSDLPDATVRLEGYLGMLLEKGRIGEGELRRLIAGLERGELVNPIYQVVTEVGAVRVGFRDEIHFQGLQEFVEQASSIDLAALLAWAREKLAERVRIHEEREVVREETKDLHWKMVFHPIEPGEFEMGEKGSKVPVNLTHPFEMMETVVTQQMWVEVMEENPSEFTGGTGVIEVTVKGKTIKMLPDHPVENITWWSALVFANKLSQTYGLKPVYDLSGVVTEDRAEDGTLKAVRGELKINAPNGNIYEAEGYRLPTEAEWEFVVRDRGRANGIWHFGDNEADLERYAWFDANSDKKTHPVGEKNPLVVDGHSFYDLHGNVLEWVQDWHAESLPGGEDPVGPSSGSYRVLRGGCWYNYARYLRSANRNFYSPEFHYSYVGLRLVRTRR